MGVLRQARGNRCVALAVVILSMAVFAGGCATDRQVISQARDVHSGLAPAVINDPQIANYMQSVGDRIIQAAQEYTRETGGSKPFQKAGDSSWIFDGGLKFHLVNSKTLNAFTTGGEHMYVYNQLLQECDSEDALAAVMAHEFAHVYSRHVAKGINRQYAGLGAAAVAGAAGYAVGGSARGQEYGGTFAGAALAASQFITAGFTRDDENEADKLGFSFYVRAGWDPAKFDDFFQHLIEKGLDTTPELLSDHPSLKNRVTATKERINRLPRNASEWRRPEIANANQFHQLQQRANEDARNSPSDETLAKAQTLLSAFPSCVTAQDQPDQKAAQTRLVQAFERDAARAQRRR